MIRKGLALTYVVGLAWIDILDHMIKEPPLPYDVAVHVHLDDGVHLSILVIARWVAAGCDGLLVGNSLVGDVERGVGAQLSVEDSLEIMVRGIIGPRLSVSPHDIIIPVHLYKAAAPAGIISRRIQDVSIRQEPWIGAYFGPGTDHVTFHIDQVGSPSGPKKGVAIAGTVHIPEACLRGSLQSFVSRGRMCQCDSEKDYVSEGIV